MPFPRLEGDWVRVSWQALPVGPDFPGGEEGLPSNAATSAPSNLFPHIQFGSHRTQRMESDVAHTALWQHGRTAFAVIFPENTRGRDATHGELTRGGPLAKHFVFVSFQSGDGFVKRVSLSQVICDEC